MIDWKTVKVDDYPLCDGETVYVGINSNGFCGCFNSYGNWGGDDSECFYETAEESIDVMTGLKWWAKLDMPVTP